MRQTTFSRYIAQLADAVNLQELLDRLADFLLQSGFAGGSHSHPYWGDFGGEQDGDRSVESLKDAIVKALMESGQLTPDMLKALRGESTGEEAKDAEVESKNLGDKDLLISGVSGPAGAQVTAPSVHPLNGQGALGGPGTRPPTSPFPRPGPCTRGSASLVGGTPARQRRH